MTVVRLIAIAVLAILPAAANADLQFEKHRVDVGDVHASLPIRYQFAFVNNGSSTVEIVEVRPSCGCLKPSLKERTFAPAQKGEIPLEIHTLGQAAGPHDWQLTVIYRDGDKTCQQVMQVTATVVTEVSVQPSSLTVVTSGAIAHELLIADQRPAPLKIVRIESTSPNVKAVAQPLTASDFGGFSAKIKVTVTEEMSTGRHEETLVIYTDDPVYGELRVPVTVVKQ
jgi:hypothetical protein